MERDELMKEIEKYAEQLTGRELTFVENIIGGMTGLREAKEDNWLLDIHNEPIKFD